MISYSRLLGGYKNIISGDKWLDDLFKVRKWNPTIKDDVEDFITTVFGDLDITLLWSESSNDVKISRSLSQEVEEYCDSHEWWTLRGDAIKYKNKNLFRLGNGSVGRMSTETQERATCDVWNAYESGTELTIDSVALITNIEDKSWLKSLINQINAIEKLVGKGFTATRYNEGNVGKAYAQMINRIIQNHRETEGNKVQKDTIDPSDIILYKDESIISELNKLATEWNGEEYMKLFKDKKIIGVSLKKSTGHAKYKNVDKMDVEVKSMELGKRAPRGTKAYVKTNIGNLTVVFRSFQASGAPAMDILSDEVKTASLGKVPVWAWTKHITNDLEKGMDDFDELIKSGDKETIRKFIELGAKINSPVPYILVY